MIMTFFALLAATASAPPNAGSFALLGAIVAAVRCKHAIGGWLFFFMWQVFIGFGLAAVQVARDWRTYTPAGWSGSNLYLIYIMAMAPRLTALFGVTIASFMLLRMSDWSWAMLLRTVLIIYIFFVGVSIAVDCVYFPADLAINCASLLFPSVLLAYTYQSQRFRKSISDARMG